MSLNPFILAEEILEIIVLTRGAVPLAPTVPSSTVIPARLKHVQGHSSLVHMVGGRGVAWKLRRRDS